MGRQQIEEFLRHGRLLEVWERVKDRLYSEVNESGLTTGSFKIEEN